jgi:hypothetical protein
MNQNMSEIIYYFRNRPTFIQRLLNILFKCNLGFTKIKVSKLDLLESIIFDDGLGNLIVEK